MRDSIKTAEITAAFQQAIAEICKPWPPVYTHNDDPDGRLKRFLNETLQTIPDGKQVLDFLQKNDIKVVWDSQMKILGRASVIPWFISPEKGWIYKNKSILLSPHHPDALLVAVLFHEMQHMRQAVHGVMDVAKNCSPFDAAWQSRVIEADAHANSAIVLLKMKLSGNESAFDTVKTDPKYGDIYAEAEKQYEEYGCDPQSLEDGRVRRKVFDAWFSPDRKNIYDERITEHKWSFLEREFKKPAKKKPLKGRLTRKDIEKVGIASGGEVNYLTLPGFRPLDDFCYKEGFNDENKRGLQDLHDEWESANRKPSTKLSGLHR